MLRPNLSCTSPLRQRVVRAVVIIVLVVGVTLLFLIVYILPHDGGRAVVPGTIHVEIGSQLRTQLGQDLFTGERVGKGIIVEILHHLVCDDDRILCLPRFRPVLQNPKLKRKAVCMGLDKCIHSPRVGVKVRTVARTRHLQRFSGRRAQSQDALLAVDLERVLAENL